MFQITNSCFVAKEEIIYTKFIYEQKTQIYFSLTISLEKNIIIPTFY